MTGGLYFLLNRLLARRVAGRTRIEVGPGSRIRWWSLRHIRGGDVRIGRDCIVHCRIDFDSPGGAVRMGDRCYVGNSHLVCHTGITLGDDVIISWGVTVVDHNSHSIDWAQRRSDVADWMQGIKRWDHVPVAPVRIGSKAWIGFGATILKGVTIGEGAVVGAQSVVTKDVAPYTVVAGNPARVIRHLSEAQEQL